MATIDDKNVIRDLITSDGYFEDDPRVYQVVEYTNYEGKKTWGVTWENEEFNRVARYEIPTQYIKEPKVIWRASDDTINIQTKR